MRLAVGKRLIALQRKLCCVGLNSMPLSAIPAKTPQFPSQQPHILEADERKKDLFAFRLNTQRIFLPSCPTSSRSLDFITVVQRHDCSDDLSRIGDSPIGICDLLALAYEHAVYRAEWETTFTMKCTKHV